MILPCGHSSESLQARQGIPWDKSQCAHCWNFLNNPDAPKLYAGMEKKPRIKANVGPSLASQAMTIAEEYVAWVAVGKPRRSPEAVEAIRTICRTCPLFDAVNGNCKSCGCGISKVRPLLSGLSALSLGIIEAISSPEMSTTSCPLNPPKWTASYIPDDRPS